MPTGIPFEKCSERTKAISKKANESKRKLWEQHPEIKAKTVKKMSAYHTKNNSMNGKCWCVPIGSTNHEKDKKVFPADNIPEGWISATKNRDMRKRKSGVYGKYWIHNPFERKNKYHTGDIIPEGWFKGRKMEYY